MANRKISELTSRTPALSDLMLVGDPSSGYSYKCTVTALATIIETDIADGFVTIGTTQTVSGAKTFSNNLTLTSVANTPTDPDKFLTLNASNVVTYRTGSQVLSDIGGASSSSISGTTNYIPKFTSSTAIGNSIMYESIAGIGVGLTSPSATFHVNGTGRFEGSLYASEAYLSSPNNIVGIIDSTNANGGFLQFSTSSTVIAEMGASQSVIGSSGNNLFALNAKGSRDLILATNATERVRIASTGSVTLSTIANATIDTDKFLVSDSGVIKYRTGAEVLSDIGGASSSSISGTTNYIPKFTSSSAIGNSVIQESSSLIGIGMAPVSGYKLNVSGLQRNEGANTTLNFGELDANNIYFQALNLAGNTNKGFVWYGTSEYMRISSTGNVSIGNTNNTYKLDVSGDVWFKPATGYNVLFQNSGTTLRMNYLNDAGSANISATYRATDFGWQDGSGNGVLTLNSSGNLGLGVSPSAWNIGTALEIANGPAILGFVNETFIANNAYYNGGWKYRATATAQAYFMNGGEHKWQIAASGTAGNAISFTQAMTLDASGNLGLGTSSPQANLHIQSSQASMNLRSTSTSSPYIDFYTSTSSLVGNFYALNGGGLAWGTSGGSEKMRLDNSGNLGLGVSPESWFSGYKVLQVNNFSIGSYLNSSVYLGHNYYTNTSGNDIYRNNGFATNYAQFSGQHTWYTAPSGTAGNAISFTQAMTLDASGRLGIGSTSPTQKLDVVISSGPYNSRFYNSSTSTSEYNVLLFSQGASGSATGYIGTGGSAVGGAFANNFVIGTQSNNALVLSTNDFERMRITSGGNVLVGSSTDLGGNYKLQLNNASGDIAMSLKSSASAYSSLINMGAAGAGAGTLFCDQTLFVVATSNGVYLTPNSTSWTGNSDSRLKNIIRPIENSVDKLMQLNPVVFSWKSDSTNRENLGLIAQEVESILPQIIDIQKDSIGTKGIRYTELIPVLVQAIKELKAEIETLKNK